MSVYYGYRCKRCDKVSGMEFNQGGSFLESLKDVFLRTRAFIGALYHSGREDLLADPLIASLKFLNRHRAHLDEVEIVDETCKLRE
ncbi:MAG: hypothetical protein AAB295_05195 [Chloroflexota bacterium]